jgi:glycosyltransferase involved in cell wall biosynthesis
MNNPPLVSVVIPTLPDRKKVLKRAIDSVMAQTYKDIETVVVSEGNSATEARNIGIERSNGDFIAFLDDDDEWMPEKIKKQMEVIKQHPSCPLVICYSHDMRFGQDRINRPPDVINHRMIIKSFNLSSTSSYLVRKATLEKAVMPQVQGDVKKCGVCMDCFDCWYDFERGIYRDGKVKCGDVQQYLYKKRYFDTSLESGQEYDLAIRLSEYYDVRCVPEVLIIQHATEGQISENWDRKINGIKAIAKKYKDEYTWIDKLKTFGVINLFRIAKIPGVGNKIYKIIIPIKERYEK